MKGGIRQSMAWLHTWTGLLLGWLLFMIFLAGTASYFRDEISVYMRPEIPSAPLNVPQSADAAQRFLEANAAGASRWFVTPPTPRNPGELSVFWVDEERQRHNPVVDVRTGERLETRQTRGGDFFYRLHFDLHYMSARTARWIVGFAAMMMFVAIVSGVITHKKIFRDFFTFRPNKRKRSWLDAHNALAVLSLPYHAVITYTGLITLMFLYMPWGVDGLYGEDTGPFFDEVFAEGEAPEKSGQAAKLASIGDMARRAQAHFGSDAVGFITVLNPGDDNARVSIREAADRRVAYNTTNLEFGRDGRLLTEHSNDGAAKTRDVLYGLHIARFADTGLRWLLFLVGLAGTAMVGTGLVLWNVKREPARGRRTSLPFGERLVASLNVGVVAGLPLAMASFFWANRLLPLEVAERQEWEIHCFFMVWLAAVLWGFLRHDRRAWQFLFLAGAAAFAGLPIITALTTSRGLPGSALDGDLTFAVFDAAMLAFAGLFALTAWLLRQPATAPSTRRAALDHPGTASR